MRGKHRAKEMKRRASQSRATHKARRAALKLKAEARMTAGEAEKDRKKIGSKGPVKLTAKASKAKASKAKASKAKASKAEKR